MQSTYILNRLYMMIQILNFLLRICWEINIKCYIISFFPYEIILDLVVGMDTIGVVVILA